MTAASGVLHKEYHEENFSRSGGIFQMVQLWVNLPSEDKMSNPKYQAIKNAQIPRHILDNNLGEIEVIAGQYKDIDGTASTFSPINMFNVKLKSEAKANFSFPAHYNTSILVIEGNITINGSEKVSTDHFVLFENKGENFSIEAKENAIILVLSGAPLNESIVARGPFVMNTQQEIIEAYDDYNNGKFGYLE